MIKKIILNAIKLYRNFISPCFPRHCRFHPSCSEYCYLAISKYGLLRGLWFSVKRVMKCHPWNLGGVDLP